MSQSIGERILIALGVLLIWTLEAGLVALGLGLLAAFIVGLVG